MTENGHKHDFPSRDDIRDFLRTLKPDAPSMFKALDDVSMGAVDKWYRDTEKGGNEISATNLLRVVLSLGAEERMQMWLRKWAKPSDEDETLAERAARVKKAEAEYQTYLRKQARAEDRTA